MASSNGPVTKADLAATEKRIKEFLGNELRHRDDDITDFKAWRDEFVAEGGPWRSMDRRVTALEYLAKSIKWVIAALTPIALWAIMEIIKAAVAWARGGP